MLALLLGCSLLCSSLSACGYSGASGTDSEKETENEDGTEAVSETKSLAVSLISILNSKEEEKYIRKVKSALENNTEFDITVNEASLPDAETLYLMAEAAIEGKPDAVYFFYPDPEHPFSDHTDIQYSANAIEYIGKIISLCKEAGIPVGITVPLSDNGDYTFSYDGQNAAKLAEALLDTALGRISGTGNTVSE